MEEVNVTLELDFIFTGFAGNSKFHYILFAGLLLVFLITLAGNVLVISVIYVDYHLHMPMYFFLATLSLVEISYLCVIIPNLLINFVIMQLTISSARCFTQFFFFFLFTSSDFLLLSIMSYDRFVAVCHPLRYHSIMKNRVCVQLVVFCLLVSCFHLLYLTVMISKLQFCGRVLNHFFCDNWALLRLSCTDTTHIKLIAFISSVFILLGSLLVTAISYICILSTVIRIPSDTGRQKTLSTCVSHFTMVSIVYGSAIFTQIRPPKEYSAEADKVVNLVSVVLAPLLNPLVYTLRNQKVKDCIRIMLNQKKSTK